LEVAPTVNVTLLGPQRTSTVHRVVRSLDVDGRIATVTAGWREREANDGELNELLDGRAVNLSLYRRWLDVQERDPEFGAAYHRHRNLRDEMQEMYLVRLDYALRAIDAIRHTGREGGCRTEYVNAAIEDVRKLDGDHLDAVTDLEEDFYGTWAPHSRPVIAEHRQQVADLLHTVGAVVVTGGHVDVLLTVLTVFDVAAVVRSPLIAWSAGAIALTERVVLFHDRAPQGPGNAEIYGRGMSVVRGIVALPHARARLLLDDVDRMSVFARRCAPARCLLLESGARIDTDHDGTCPPEARILGVDGRPQTIEGP
jgi:hypothetical protein